MLDFLVIFLFSKQIGRWAEKKGYKRGMFQGLVIGAWFAGEIVGLIIGVLAFSGSDPEERLILAMIPALLGAGAGIMTLVFIVMSLPFRARPAMLHTAVGRAAVEQATIEPAPERPPVTPWVCPHCGYNNTYRDDRCFNCKKEKPAAPG